MYKIWVIVVLVILGITTAWATLSLKVVKDYEKQWTELSDLCINYLKKQKDTWTGRDDAWYRMECDIGHEYSKVRTRKRMWEDALGFFYFSVASVAVALGVLLASVVGRWVYKGSKTAGTES